MADWSKNYSHINWQNGQSPYLEAQNLNYDQGWIAELVDRTVELNDATLPVQELQGYVDEAEGYAESASTSADNASTSANNASTSADNASASATSAQASAEEAERQAHLSAGANAIDYDVDTSTLSLMHDSTVLDTTTIISGGGDIVTEWETTPSDEKVPSEKLVKTSLESLNDDIDAKQDKLTNPLTQSDVVDNLTSTSTVLPLSANQGKALKESLVNIVGCDAWVSGKAYSVGDCAIYNNTIYECIIAHTSSDSVLPTNTTYWKSTSISKLGVLVEQVSISYSIASGTTTEFTKSVSKSGYNAIGIVGYNNTCRPIWLNRFQIVNNVAYVMLSNKDGYAHTDTIYLNILYTKQ